MKDDFKLAWRNIWRNKRRTAITVASIFIAVVLSALMTSMQEGQYSSMVDNIVKLYSGYIQIHQKDFWDNKTINNIFTVSEEETEKIKHVEGVGIVCPRLESYALASSGNQTNGTLLMGIEPVLENKVTNLSHWVKTGKYLKPGDDGVLVAVNLAKQLQLGIGDSIVLLSQGYHGASAADVFPIRGILEFAAPQMNNKFIYLDIQRAREFYSAENMNSSLVVMISDYKEVNKVRKKLNNIIGDDLHAMTWEEMQPEIVQMIDLDRMGGVFMKGIIYMIIGFGIFGTVIMMLAERKRELGVLVAIGMKKNKLNRVLFIETLLLGFIGIVIGIIISFPIVLTLMNYPIPLSGDAAKTMIEFGMEPVIYFSTIPKVYVNQAIVVLLMTLLVSLYPLIKIQSLTVVKAIHS